MTPADGVVVTADGAKQSRVDEDRGVEQAGDGGNIQFLIVRGNGTGNVVEIIRRNQLADAKDEPVLQESLPIPELIKLGAVQGFGAGQAVVALHAAGLAVGVLAIELEKLNAERRAFPADEFLGVEIRADDEGAVPAPFAGFRPAGDEAVGIRQPKAAEPQAGFLRKVKDATGQAGAGEVVFRRRIACDGLGNFPAKLIEKRDRPLRGLLGPHVRNQRTQNRARSERYAGQSKASHRDYHGRSRHRAIISTA